MFLSTGVMAKESGSPVQLPSINFNNSRFDAICYSGVRFDNDGKIYRMSAAGSWNYQADWLLSGAASSYYLWRTVQTGTLTNDDGDGIQLNTANNDYWVSSLVPFFFRTASVEFKISDDSAGSNILVTKTYNFSAYVESTGSPP